MEIVIDRAKALKYFTEQLSEGTSLSKLVLEKIDLSVGIFRIAMPTGTDQTDITFHGGVRGLRSARKEFACVIERFIKVTDGTALIEDSMAVEDVLRMEAEPFQDRMVTYGHEVYWQANGPALSDADIKSLLNYPLLPYPLCVFFHLAGDIRNKSELHRQDLERIIANLVGVAVSAFDNVSYLLWWGEDLIPFSRLAGA